MAVARCHLSILGLGTGQAPTFPTVESNGHETSTISDACKSTLLALSGNFFKSISKSQTSLEYCTIVCHTNLNAQVHVAHTQAYVL